MRYLRYGWALPATVIGLVAAMLALRRGRLEIVDGVVEAHGPLLQWALTTLVPVRGGAGAMTLGHVVIAQDAQILRHTREHERVHVRQYERWGLLFIPAYFIASVYAALRGRHYYFDNVFEREARLACSVQCANGSFGSRNMQWDDTASTRALAMNRSTMESLQAREAKPSNP